MLRKRPLQWPARESRGDARSHPWNTITSPGRRVVALALKLKELVIVPALAVQNYYFC
ncbi:MAG: hypothetical protein ACUBOA_09345 [Candidatus Loosdrechtia sp.]